MWKVTGHLGWEGDQVFSVCLLKNHFNIPHFQFKKRIKNKASMLVIHNFWLFSTVILKWHLNLFFSRGLGWGGNNALPLGMWDPSSPVRSGIDSHAPCSRSRNLSTGPPRMYLKWYLNLLIRLHLISLVSSYKHRISVISKGQISALIRSTKYAEFATFFNLVKANCLSN